MSSGRHPYAVVAVKTVHTAVFLVELAAIGWLVVTGLVGRRNRTVALAAGAVAAEAAVFLANDGVCPLTPLTERLGATNGAVSDIFLPDVVARTIPIWSSALIALAALLHARSALRGRGGRQPLLDGRSGTGAGGPAARIWSAVGAAVRAGLGRARVLASGGAPILGSGDAR